MAGQASFNVAPYAAGGYFVKVACFCFERQVLGPGERVEMPVSFFVDPAIIEDAEARGLSAITLSYTMHAADLPEEDIAAATSRGARPDDRTIGGREPWLPATRTTTTTSCRRASGR